MMYYPLKILLAAGIVLSYVHAGHGIIGEEQPRLDIICKDWKKGDKLPDYLLSDNREYNPLTIYTPSMYISRYANEELLRELLVYPRTPQSNFDTAMSRLLERQRLKGFALHLNNIQSMTPRIMSLKKDFSGKCFKVHAIYIDKADMEPGKAVRVLSDFGQDLKQAGDLQAVYVRWSERYSYSLKSGGWRTKVGNMGHFYFFKKTSRIFPSNKTTLEDSAKIKIGNLENGGTVIIQEKISEEDKEVKRLLGDIVSTATSDRTVLYIVTEKH